VDAPSRRGVFVFPNNQTVGTLDELILACGADSYASALDCADRYLDDAVGAFTPEELKEFRKPAGRLKAMLSAVGAILGPGKSIQMSIENNRWVVTDVPGPEALQQVVAFLEALATRASPCGRVDRPSVHVRFGHRFNEHDGSKRRFVRRLGVGVVHDGQHRGSPDSSTRGRSGSAPRRPATAPALLLLVQRSDDVDWVAMATRRLSVVPHGGVIVDAGRVLSVAPARLDTTSASGPEVPSRCADAPGMYARTHRFG
jgi:hypothetical protein